MTNRDLSFINAIDIVFPSFTNLLCQFHMDKNVGVKCRHYVLKDRQKTILDLLKNIVYLISVAGLTSKRNIVYSIDEVGYEEKCFKNKTILGRFCLRRSS